MKKLNSMAAALMVAGLGIGGAQASETFQGVTFTTSYVGNVLTVEIDAAARNGDWALATTIGALQVKDVGTFDSVSMTGPGAASSWAISPLELDANGCMGGSHVGMNACASGTHVALTDDMIFTYTFTGTGLDLTDPHLKVNFFVGDNDQKVGSLLSENIAAVPEPGEYAMLLGGLAVIGLALKRRAR
ncbi:PEP-CTERM sorting domain-containing protein [Zemynaea arenosa]|nr:PEP-CTERM sorting domain-containing protein [Massilia arenosa]